MRAVWSNPISEATEKKIMELVSPGDGARLFDFGAGYGRYLKMFCKYFERENLYGAEIDEEAIEVLKEEGFQCYKPEYEIAKVPFKDEYFDFIFCSNVIEHIPRTYYLKYLKEFYRVLKRKGRLIIGTPNYPIKRLYDLKKAFETKMYRYYLFDDPTHVNRLSIKQLRKDLEDTFPVVKLDPTYIFFENSYRWIRENRQRLAIFGDKISGYCEKL